MIVRAPWRRRIADYLPGTRQCAYVPGCVHRLGAGSSSGLAGTEPGPLHTASPVPSPGSSGPMISYTLPSGARKCCHTRPSARCGSA